MDVKTILTSIVALLSLAVAVFNGRKANQQAKEIESLKFDLQRKGEKAQKYHAEMAKAYDAIGEMISAIQVLKDKLQMILSAFDTSLDAKGALDAVRGAREDLFTCYEKNLPFFLEEEKLVSHAAKNMAHTVEQILTMALQDYEWASCLSDAHAKKVIQHRKLLSDKQDRLRDFQRDRLRDMNCEI